MSLSLPPAQRGDRALPASGLRRDLELLDVLADAEGRHRGGLGVVRLAALVGRDKSQISRALQALAGEGVVERDAETLEYRLGWRLFALAAHTVEAQLVERATPFLRRLVAAVAESAHLCVLRDGQVVTLSSESPAGRGYRGLGPATVAPLVPAGASTRVLVCGWPEELLRAWFPDDRAGGSTSSTLRTVADLVDDGRRIRERGYAAEDEDVEIGVAGVAAPVYGARGEVVAAVSVAAPCGRLRPQLGAVGRSTAELAGELSAALGAPAAARRGHARVQG